MQIDCYFDVILLKHNVHHANSFIGVGIDDANIAFGAVEGISNLN